MKTLAAVALFVNVLAGVVVLAFWSDPSRRSDHRSLILAVTHVVLAITATMSWVAFLIFRSDFQLLAGTGAVVAAVLTGTLTVLSSRIRERSTRFGDAPAPVPPAVLVVHAGFASVAAILIVVVAVQH